jgi:hypothetical protein|nr:MAG TPA: hypothetical protein [Caudoviricetes sp.]
MRSREYKTLQEWANEEIVRTIRHGAEERQWREKDDLDTIVFRCEVLEDGSLRFDGREPGRGGSIIKEWSKKDIESIERVHTDIGYQFPCMAWVDYYTFKQPLYKHADRRLQAVYEAYCNSKLRTKYRVKDNTGKIYYTLVDKGGNPMDVKISLLKTDVNGVELFEGDTIDISFGSKVARTSIVRDTRYPRLYFKDLTHKPYTIASARITKVA